MTDPQHDSEPAEHLRYAHYLQALDAVAEPEEADLVTAVLRDQDVAMAQGAVVHHLDRRAYQLLTDTEFTAWSHLMASAIVDRDYLSRRLREWTLLRTIAMNEPWAGEELVAASDWFQRTATTARITTSSDALGLLAGRGRTRRVRNAGSRRMERLEQSPN